MWMKNFRVNLLTFVILALCLNFACDKRLSLVRFDEALSPEERMELGMIYFKEGEIEQAKKQFQAVIFKERDNFSAWFYLGLTHHHLGEYEQAVKAFKNALALNPGSGEAHNNLADAYLRLNKLEWAEKEVKTALELGGENIGYYYLTYGEILFEKRERESGCLELEQAVVFSNNDEALKKLVLELWEKNCAKDRDSKKAD